MSDDYEDDMTISTKNFEHQIQLLRKYYYMLSTKELFEWLDGKGEAKQRKGVFVTLDDGYEDNFLNALPILKKYSCPAIFFISTGFIGNRKQFDHDKLDYPDKEFNKMTWEQLKKASKAEIEIGIHSDTHIDFGSSSFENVCKEIGQSLLKYKQHLGEGPVVMAHPFGGKTNITEKVRDYVRQHHDISASFSAYGGRNICPHDKYDIKRMFIGSNNRGLIFRYRVEGGYRSLFDE